jgi:hypothetical protein
MTNAWIQHVKSFQATHGCTYKEAMTLSRPSYNAGGCCSQEGGSLKSVMRKAKNSLKQGKKATRQVTDAIDKNQQFANLVLGDEMAGKIQNASNQAKQINESIGGKFKLGRAIRKAKNTAREVKKIAKVIQPMVATVNPAAGMAMESAIVATGGSYKALIAKHKQKKGGSFSVPRTGAGAPKGKHEFSNQYAMMSTTHPSMAPVKPKLK